MSRGDEVGEEPAHGGLAFDQFLGVPLDADQVAVVHLHPFNQAIGSERRGRQARSPAFDALVVQAIDLA